MKKTLLIATTSLFVIGQAMAQNQPSGQQSNPPGAQTEQSQMAPGTAKSRHLKKVRHQASTKRNTHRTARYSRSRQAAPTTQQTGFFGFGPQPGWNQQAWNQQQGWGWNQQPGWGWNQQGRPIQRASNQQNWNAGWNPGGPCRGGRRPDGARC
jgi:hypothetical protein